MAKVMVLLVAVNAACGITAFVVANRLFQKANRAFRELMDDEEESGQEERHRR